MWPAVRTEGELGRGVGAGAEQERKPGRERMLVLTGTGESWRAGRRCWAGVRKEKRPGWAEGRSWARAELAAGLGFLLSFFWFLSSFLFPLKSKLFELKFRFEFKTLALKQNENHAPA